MTLSLPIVAEPRSMLSPIVLSLALRLYAVSDSYEPRGYDVPVVTHLIGGNLSFCLLAGLRPIKKC